MFLEGRGRKVINSVTLPCKLFPPSECKRGLCLGLAPQTIYKEFEATTFRLYTIVIEIYIQWEVLIILNADFFPATLSPILSCDAG